MWKDNFRKAILDENHDIVDMSDDLIGWARAFENSNRIVEQTIIKDGDKEYFVSTIFLGLSHQFLGNGAPLWFETMVFDKDNHSLNYQDRYSTWDEAVVGHKATIALVQKGEIK